MPRYRVVEIKKGDMVHDVISGFAGIVTNRVHHLHGTVEWMVESERTQGMASETRAYAEKEILRLRVLGNQLEGEETKTPAIKLGDIVKDRITGFQGTVTRLFDGLHGTKEWSIESETSPFARYEVRLISEKETARLVVVGSASDHEKPIPGRLEKPAKKRHNRR